jgi:hypothetical protein
VHRSVRTQRPADDVGDGHRDTVEPVQDVELSADEAVLANRITAIDTELDALLQREETVLASGLHGGAIGGWAAHEAEDALDQKKAALLAERADLAKRLKSSVRDDRDRGQPIT